MIKILDVQCLIGQEGGLNYPSGLCFDRQEEMLFICDMQNKRVAQYRYYIKKAEASINLFGDNKHILKRPLAITLSVTKNLYLTDAEQNCIFTYKENQWREISIRGNWNIILPGSIAVDSEDNLYITDFLNDRICRIDFNRNLEELREFKCRKPYGIFVQNNILYITDTDNNIQWLNLITKDHGLIDLPNISPIAITVDKDGDIYFSENRKLYFFNQKHQKLELLLNTERWKQYGFDKLCHIGALVSISRDRIIFSDTIKNCIYQMTLQKYKE